MSEPFISEIRMFGFNFAPRGWSFCNGQLLAISQNTALFSLIGTIYGGDGRTTFALPDLRGRSPINLGHGTGLSNRVIGSKSGSETVTLSVNQIPSHRHNVAANSAAATGSPPPTNNFPAAFDTSIGVKIYHDSQNGTFNPGAVLPTGGSDAHNNLQPSLVVNFCIALVGLFPSRN